MRNDSTADRQLWLLLARARASLPTLDGQQRVSFAQLLAVFKRELEHWQALASPEMARLIQVLLYPSSQSAFGWHAACAQLPQYLARQRSLSPQPEAVLFWSAKASLVAARQLAEKISVPGASAARLDLLETATRLLPGLEHLHAFTDYALAQGQAGRALEIVQVLSQQSPHHLGLQLLQARVLVALQRAQEALDLLLSVDAHAPEVALALGNVYQSLGDLPAAQQSYARALQLTSVQHPLRAGILLNAGWLKQQLLDFEAAESDYLEALQRQPHLPEAWNNLCALYLELGEHEKAREALSLALQQAPDFAPAWVNQGIVYAQQGQQAEALQAFARARALQPQLEAAWKEAAALLLDARDSLHMQQLLQRALALLPHSAELHWIHSRLLWLLNRPEAQAVGERACALAPQRRFWPFQLALGHAAAQALEPEKEQTQYLEHLQLLLDKQSQAPFKAAEVAAEMRYLPELLWHLAYISDRPCVRIKRSFAACFDFSALQQRFQSRAPGGRTQNESPQGKTRLGVVITHGHEGIFLRLAAPLLSHLAPEWELVWLGDSARLKRGFEELRGELEHAREPQYVDLPRQLWAAANCIVEQKLNLLYYWEVGSDVLNAFLPFLRLAPVQFTSWGTPMTTGIPNVDYFISSRQIEPEEAAHHYTEQLLLLPTLPHYCPDPRPQAAKAERRDYALLEQGPLYGCFQNPFKYCERFIWMLSELLTASPTAQLLLLQSAVPWFQDDLAQRMQKQLGPEQWRRVRWLPLPLSRPDFLGAMQRVDVVLDTFHYSGGQTADEALLLGKPLVTLPGRSARNRLSFGRLKQLRLDACIAQSLEDYLQICLRLGRDPDFYAEICAQLEEGRSRLQCNPQAPQQWGEALRQMQASRQT